MSSRVKQSDLEHMVALSGTRLVSLEENAHPENMVNALLEQRDNLSADLLDSRARVKELEEALQLVWNGLGTAMFEIRKAHPGVKSPGGL